MPIRYSIHACDGYNAAKEMEKYDSSKDYYRELGVRRDASAEEIDRAYRSAARKRHPDGGGSEEEMKSLNEAHDVLSDRETRAAYDQERRPMLPAQVSPQAFDPEAASRAGTLSMRGPALAVLGLMLDSVGAGGGVAGAGVAGAGLLKSTVGGTEIVFSFSTVKFGFTRQSSCI